MGKSDTRAFRPRVLGELPVDKINKALGTELEPGNGWLSSAAHEHIAISHQNDYQICAQYLNLVLTQPMYVRQASKHARNFELIRRVSIPGKPIILVAVSLERNTKGHYNVRSSYIISDDDLNAKRNSGSLKILV